VPTATYTKEFVAREQLETAISLFEEGRDLLSVITLAGAADEILGKLVTEAGGVSSLANLQAAALAIHQHLFQEPGDAKWIADRANRARNSLKHLDTDEGRTVTLDPAEEATDMLDRAITNYWSLTVTLTPTMERHERSRRAI
jgi:hypothetical protein